jgi:CHU_C Type IX secretion signal domain
LTMTPELEKCEDYFVQYGCNFNNFSNILTWTTTTDPDCAKDISHYRIYYALTPNSPPEEYKLLVDLADRPNENTYTDSNLPSFARCYRLVAVDRSGNESEFSEEVCNDNCPNYRLPNVFTPGNGDECNDFFSAFSDRARVLNCGSIPNIRELCPRFVLKVEITIVNRWGQPVFNYSTGGENDIYVDWNGTDNDGKTVAAGIYFYSAKVTYNMLNPKDREETIKGWIHLIRAD